MSLTEQQLAMLVQEEVTGIQIHNVGLALEISGRLDVERLAYAVEAVCAAHPLLRCRVEFDQSTVPRVVLDPTSPSDPRPRLTVHRTAAKPSPADLREVFDARFDWRSESPFRAHVWISGPKEASLLLVFHHAFFDGRSEVVFLEDLAAVYNSGDPSCIQSETSPAYTDDQQDADEFWLRHFASAPRDQSLGRPVPLDVTYLTHVHEEALTREAAEMICSYARSRGLTEFSMWLGVTAVAVAQASGQDAAVVGSMALDPRFASSRAIGLTSMFVPVVVTAPTDRSIGDVSEEAQSRFYEAWQHCFTQLSRIARITALQRRGTGHPVTGVRLNVQYLGSTTLHLDGALCHRMDIQPERSIMDLTIDVLRSAADVDGRTLRFTARADIFSREALAGFARSFTALASAALRAPDSPICELARAYECNESPVTVASQRSDVSSSPSPAGASLGFPRSARVMRSATIEAGSGRTMRHSLQRMVDERTAWLDAVGPHPLKVSHLAQRDVDRLCWFLACHARGDTYIPVDARWPAERKDAALAIVQPDVVVEHGNRARARTASGRRDSRSQLADTAYITFTSGSTGSPKAIPTSRAGLWHIARTLLDEFQLNDRCAIVSVSQPSFDVSILDMTLAALVGGDWIDAPPETLPGARFNGEERLLVQATPTVLSSLLSDWPFPPERTTIVSGGEALTASLADRILQTSCRLFNIYGPTELSVWTTLAEVLPGQPVTVGRPLPGRTVRLLGESLRRVVPGTPGELCISGVGLFPGYLNGPSDALVEDPYTPGRLLYRTGDYGIHDRHGNIVFVGRTDDQIKIRGQRAELSEVRWAVTDTQLCEEVAVKFAPPEDGTRALLSVYVTGLRCNPGELWTRLEERLPEYMLPDEIVVLERFPRTTTDKIDLSALASRGARVWRRTAAPCAADGEQRTVVPSQLADIWRSVLGSPSDDGAAEDFYAAGGNSLSALTLVRRVQDAYRVTLDLKEFLRAPSLSRLHQLVQHGRPQELEAPPSAALTAGQRGRLEYRRQTTTSAVSPEADMLRLVYRLSDGVEVDAIREAWSALVERHDALRCYVTDEGVQSTVGASARFEVMRVGRPDDVPTVFTTMRFTRASTSTMTLATVEGPASSAYLCIGLNRLFVDGASVSVIKRDLSGMLRGQPPSVPPESWLHWCVEQSTADRDADLAALRSDLAGRPLSGGFPNRPRPSSPVRSRMFTGTSSGVMDPPGPDAPVGATREPAVSVLIAAAAAAHKVFGEPVWQIGMLFANRQDSSAAVAVGNFSNVVPVILPPDHRGPPSWDIALARASRRQGLPLATAYQVLEPSSYPFPWRQPQLLLSVTYGAEEAGDAEPTLLEADCRLPPAVEPSASLFVHASLGRTGRVSVLTEGAEGVYSAGECSDFASAAVGELIAQREGS
ncbi:AMP-binding protein [Cellulomonas carbonis]|uniref:AMP-binding protein n=1 Tax=Cellulomonas carbonis TaxID=1386092 RepID=UPI001667F087|nr:AMP-binding protein [Cellulomonas carbonis]GGC17849.1 hypothetical protein GCM10010972_33850 [Cellulomonas carbonis]